MNQLLNILLAVTIAIDHAHSITLLDRLNIKLEDPSDSRTHLNHMKYAVHHNFGEGTDTIVGPKSLMHVGSFRGKPIVARQRNTFVDDNGVPIPLLPYNYDSWRIHTRPLY